MKVDFYNDLKGQSAAPFGQPSFRVYQFICRNFYGRAIDTVEMKNFDWHDVCNLPENEMILGDPLFLKYIICEDPKPAYGHIRRDCEKDKKGNYTFFEVTESHFEYCTYEDLLVA